ncbi:MAG: AAA domain-containing protein [Bacilli bacterium]
MIIEGNNEKDHLILKIDDSTGKFVDVTKNIIFLNDAGRAYYVVMLTRFGEKRTYYFSFNNMRIFPSSHMINIGCKPVYLNNKQIPVQCIVQFGSGPYKVFTTNNTSFLIPSINILENDIRIFTISENTKVKNNLLFSYYYSLAEIASQNCLDDQGIEKHLFALYQKINCINPDSVLSNYYERCNSTESIEENKLIFPFMTNYSQICALRMVLQNKLSIISGPPGTGKTQVILTLLANAVCQNKKVAIISNNNTAVANVFDKMKELGMEFIIANLGNSNNVNEFFSLPHAYLPIIKEYKDSSVDQKQIKTVLSSLESLYSQKNELSKLIQKKRI